MRFELKDGSFTEVIFVRVNGVITPFPTYNTELVRREGTTEAKKLLEEILKEKNKIRRLPNVSED